MHSSELEWNDVSAGYRGATVIENISFKVGHGQRVGIIGRNGAGKTTTLAAGLGLADVMGGEVRFKGEKISGQRTFRRARGGIGYVPQTRDIFPSMTVEENLIAGLQEQSKAKLEEAYSLFPRLAERKTHHGNQLSGGEQQMLSIARALMGNPEIILLDEPLEGLAPIVAEDVMSAVDRMARESGRGFVLVEQHLDVVLNFCSEIIVLERGRTVFSGASGALKRNSEILERAIGLLKTAH